MTLAVLIMVIGMITLLRFLTTLLFLPASACPLPTIIIILLLLLLLLLTLAPSYHACRTFTW
jgi:hypothetical protein